VGEPPQFREKKAKMNDAKNATFYTHGAVGYTEYPLLGEEILQGLSRRGVEGNAASEDALEVGARDPACRDRLDNR
jgi:hypothetical protein